LPFFGQLSGKQRAWPVHIHYTAFERMSPGENV
jgi:hypothetical protein